MTSKISVKMQISTDDLCGRTTRSHSRSMSTNGRLEEPIIKQRLEQRLRQHNKAKRYQTVEKQREALDSKMNEADLRRGIRQMNRIVKAQNKSKRVQQNLAERKGLKYFNSDSKDQSSTFATIDKDDLVSSSGKENKTISSTSVCAPPTLGKAKPMVYIQKQDPKYHKCLESSEFEQRLLREQKEKITQKHAQAEQRLQEIADRRLTRVKNHNQGVLVKLENLKKHKETKQQEFSSKLNQKIERAQEKRAHVIKGRQFVAIAFQERKPRDWSVQAIRQRSTSAVY